MMAAQVMPCAPWSWSHERTIVTVEAHELFRARRDGC
jgi:hypothetical protein